MRAHFQMNFHWMLRLKPIVTSPAPIHIPRTFLMVSVTTQTLHSSFRSLLPGCCTQKAPASLNSTYWNTVLEAEVHLSPPLLLFWYWRKSFILTFGTALGTINSATEGSFSNPPGRDLTCVHGYVALMPGMKSQDPIICVFSDQQKKTCWLSSSVVKSCSWLVLINLC